LTKGTWNTGEAILTRINSSQVNNDLLGTLTNNADQQLDDMFKIINENGKGAVIVNQDMQSHFFKPLNGVKNWSEGQMKAPKIIIDSKDYGIGAQNYMISISQKFVLYQILRKGKGWYNRIWFRNY
jgi:3,4-dihydroxy 2-butanone 4-phosphate synthase/GTP cyclohydrolase II